jgi:hypothetical protein
VLEDEGGHAEIIQILCRLDAFGFEDQLAMAATGNYQDSGAVGFLLWRREDSDGGMVNIADPVIRRFRGFILAFVKPGRALFPKRNDLRFIRGGHRERQKQHEEENVLFHSTCSFHSQRRMSGKIAPP